MGSDRNPSTGSERRGSFRPTDRQRETDLQARGPLDAESIGILLPLRLRGSVSVIPGRTRSETRQTFCRICESLGGLDVDFDDAGRLEKTRC
jgi:hypothetical protein